MRLRAQIVASLPRILWLALTGIPLTAGCSDEAGAEGGMGGSVSGVAGKVNSGAAGSANSAGSAGTAGAPVGGAGASSTTAGAGGVTTGAASGSAGSSGAGGSADSAGGGAGGSAGLNGSAGSSSSAGASSSAGTGGGSTVADCNSGTGQPVLTVAPSGAQFTTVRAALNSLSKTNTTPTQIRISPGTYKEKLSIQVPNIALCGQAGKASSTILTYSDNANTSNGNGGTLGATGGASTNLSSSNVSVENITFANSTPLGGSQAVALLVSGNQVQFRNCRFLSFQDTLYVRKAKQYFRDCYVEGTVDFIFGDATAVFDNCTVKNVGGGTAASAPNTDQSVPYGLVFLGGELTAAADVKAGSVALSRNWGAYGAASFLRTKLGAHISAAGWSPMGENTLATARFSEYKTSGPGANTGARAAQSKQLTDEQAAGYSLSSIFGSWVPSFSK